MTRKSWIQTARERLEFYRSKRETETDPRWVRLVAVQIPKFEAAIEEFERTGRYDSAGYELVMGNE